MPALILINQATRPAGTAGKARSDGVVGQLVTCTNNTVEASYLWTLVDVPIRSALVRGTTGVGASFTFTPDVKGTYLVSLRVNGSTAPADNASTYIAIRTFGSKTLAWRYQAATETTEDNETYAGLGFPANINLRGWATNEDVIFEAIETAVWEIQNAISAYTGVVSRLVKTDPATGQIHPSLIAVSAGIAAVSAGTNIALSGTVAFSNSNGVTFGMDTNGVITASAVGGGGGGAALSAGTQSGNTGTIVFSNSNNVSFGMNGSSQITASASYSQSTAPAALSAGTTLASSGTVVLSNANNVTFGMNAGTVTASVPAGVTATGNFGALGAGTQTATSGTVVFSNSNNVSFGMNGSSQVTASASYSQSTAPAAISAGTTLASNGTVVFSNSNGLSFGMNAGTITGSFSTAPSDITVSAGTTNTHTNAFSFANANNVSFGMNGATVTGSIPTGATATGNFGALAAGTQTATSGTVTFANSNGVTFGMSGSNQITASYSQSTAPAAISAGTTQATNGTVVFSNSNSVTFGMNAGTVTASIPAGASATGNFGALAAGTQTATSGTVTFANSNGVTFGMSGSNQITASYSQSTAPAAFAAGTQTGTSGTLNFVNSNNVTFGLSGSSQVTASIPAGATATGNVGGLAAGTQTATSGTIAFANSNGVTFGMSGSNQITASYSQSTGLALSFPGANATTMFQTGTLVVSDGGGGFWSAGGGTVAFQPLFMASAGTTNDKIFRLDFNNSNGVTFGLSTDGASHATITASVAAVGGAQTGISGLSFPGAGANTMYTSGTVSFADFGSVAQWTTNAGSVGVVPYIRLSGGGTSTYAHSVTFSDANGVSWLMNTTTDGRVTLSLSVDPAFDGIAVVGSTLTSGIPVFSNSNNITFGMNGSTITASYQDLDVAISAGTASISSGTVVFSDSNGVSFGLNGSTLTASFDDPGLSMLSIYEPYPIHNTGTAGLSWATNTSAPMILIPFQVVHEVAADYLRMIVSMSFVTGGTSSFNQSGTLQWGIYTRNVSSLSLSTSGSIDYYASYNNSTITIQYPSSTKAGAGGYNTTTASSAGLNVSSQFTGLKLWENVLYTTLTPGYYWLGLHHRNSSSSFNSGLRMSFVGNAFSLTNLAPMGQLSSGYSTGTRLYGAQGQHMLIGSYSVNAMTALTNVVSISKITANVTVVPYMMYASDNIV